MLHPRHRARVERLVREIARKHGVRLYRFANVGNHLHLLLLAPTRIGFRRFLREMPGAIAMAVTGARKGAAAGRFWDYLPFTRIADWGRDFRNLRLYFVKNLFEAAGLLSRKARADGLRVIPIAGWGVGPPG
jgi:REP element-mobilizing transposase RayT